MSIENDGHYLNSNLVLLEMIKAYDNIQEKQYLEEALRLAKWLRRAECLQGISTINFYQCMKRKNSLSEEQEDELIKLLEKCNDNNEMKVAIYILLENYKMAKRCMNKLAADTREQFEKYPIYALMEK